MDNANRRPLQTAVEGVAATAILLPPRPPRDVRPYPNTLGLSPIEWKRFISKLLVDPDTGCWLWTASTRWDGYGQHRVGGTMMQAHRVMWRTLVGAIPEGLVLHHTCHERGWCSGGVTCWHRRCRRHLELTTVRENTLRSPNTQAYKNMMGARLARAT